MKEFAEHFRRSWFLYVPPVILGLSIALAALYGDLSFLCIHGSVAVSGCMFIAASDYNVGPRVFMAVAVAQTVMVLTASFVADSYVEAWSPRMLLYCGSTALPACYNITLNFFTCIRNPVFLAGYYPVKMFMADVGRYIFSLYNTSALLVLYSMSGLNGWMKISCSVLLFAISVVVFIIMSIRYAATHGVEAVDICQDKPGEHDVLLYKRFMEYMAREHPFLDSELTIDNICKDLGTNRAYISHCVNVCTGQSVPRIVNNFRIRYAIDLFMSDTNLKVFELSSMSGFGSVSTFSTAFRLETNMYPKEWCREQKVAVAKLGQRPSMIRVEVPEL